MRRGAAERVRYFEGALLRARDLRDDAAYESWMRGMHVRFVHDTWGVALGFELVLSYDRDRLEVGPGLAYDCAGREILSPASVIMAAPRAPSTSGASAWWFDLAVRYDGLCDLAPGLSPFGCGTGELLARTERPWWTWAFAGDAGGDSAEQPPLAPGMRVGEDVPLARFRVGADGTFGLPDLAVRRSARPTRRPHVAGGRFSRPDPIAGTVGMWSVSVDTAAAGFRTMPLYFARLEAHPFAPSSGFADGLTAAGLASWLAHPEWVLGPFVSVADASPAGFTLVVHMAASPEAGVLPELEQPLALPVPVAWIGVEPAETCPPPLAMTALLRSSAEATVRARTWLRVVRHGGPNGRYLIR
jgi:hypothetical protein